MKKLTLLFIATALVGLTSCKKCADCACTYTDAFEFADGFDTDDEASKRAAYANAGNNYPEDVKEICEKKNDFDSAVKLYEEQSTVFTDGGSTGGLAWSYTGTYSCTCQE